jgi:dienelactone hydrolase
MARQLTRREWSLAAASAAALNQAPIPATSKSPAQDLSLDPVAWTLGNYSSAPLQLTFTATSKTDAEIWQRKLRAKLTDLLGGFPNRLPLQTQTLEVRNFPAYRREKFIFQSRPGVSVIGYLLIPSNKPSPHATVICIPGHGRGVDDIVGIDESGHDRTVKQGYAYDFAIQAVEHGMAAVAIEPMGFGYRRDPRTIKGGPTASSCQPAAGAALLFGQTMLGWRVWDVMRTVDWIQTHPELDPARIGCMGISGGGTCTQFASALDTRIQAAFVSGYLNTFRDSIMSLSHCIDNYVPGILNWAENYDVASLIAPRYFFSEGGDQDPIFPVNATRASFEKVKRTYEVFGVPNRAQQQIFSSTANKDFPSSPLLCGTHSRRTAIPKNWPHPTSAYRATCQAKPFSLPSSTASRPLLQPLALRPTASSMLL